MKLGSDVLRVLFFKKVSGDLLALPIVFEILSIKLCKKGVFLEKIAFYVLNLWKSTSWLKMILPTYQPIFNEISWVLPVLWSIEHVYGVSMLKWNHACHVFCEKFSTNFAGNSNIASIYHCSDPINFWDKNFKGLGIFRGRSRKHIFHYKFLVWREILLRIADLIRS